MALSTQPYKGARDFYPEDKRTQKYLFTVMRQVAERFGYEEYDAPILEPTDLFLVKGNEEIITEQTYTFQDRAERSVTIRTEMTPSVSRMVAGRRQELAYPLRWYSIPNLWRYERTQRGRLREFWQLNVDIFGVDTVAAEHELILLADQLMKAYGASSSMYSIRINSRALMDFIFQGYLGLGEVEAQSLARLIDKIQKLPPETFQMQLDAILSPSEREAGLVEKIQALLKTKQLTDLPEAVRATAAYEELLELMSLLGESLITNAMFDITIMRGFDYYTGVVFEVFDTDPENNRAMFGGGRYDGMVGQFGVDPVPTVGFGMGDVTLANFLESHQLMPRINSEADVYVALIGDVYAEAQHVIQSMREMGLNVAVDSTGRKLDRQFKSAEKKGLAQVVIIGETELASNQLVLKNLQSGEEERHAAERIVSIIKDYRNRATA